jgi:biopolymer transport protein ExbD
VNFRKHRADEPDLLIDIAPLIDVVFILLIFFMVTTTFSHESAVEIELPQASTPPQSGQIPETLTLSIDASGHYFLNDRALPNNSVEILKLFLEKEMKMLKRPALIINADADATHQSVVRAMDAARQVGLTRLSFATRFSDDGQ